MTSHSDHIPYLSEPKTLPHLKRIRGYHWREHTGEPFPKIEAFRRHVCARCGAPVRGPAMVIYGDKSIADANGLIYEPALLPQGHYTVTDTLGERWLCPTHYLVWLNPWHKSREAREGE